MSITSNRSRLQPVLTGVITQMVLEVILLTVMLEFPHLCYTFSITFALNSVAYDVQPNALGLKVLYGFHLTYLSLQYVHVFA